MAAEACEGVLYTLATPLGGREETALILEHRPATLEDFLRHRDDLAPWYGDACPDLERAWAGLLAHEGVWSLAIEDVEGPRRIVSLSLSAFVSDRFAERLESGRCPWVGGSVAARFLSRGDEPLPLDRIQAAHRHEGLSLVSLHTVAPGLPLGHSASGLVGDRRADVSGQDMRGYRLKRVLREVFSPQAYASFLAGGWRLRSDYGRHFEDGAKDPSIDHPFLLGVTHEEAADEHMGGARISAMFVDYPIRLGLRRVHRELLHAAIEGLTDAELSSRLSLSSSAVKKRWAAVYSHVEGKIPGMPHEPGRADKTRGAERRRHVLNYLREHPEEFRPLTD